MRASRLHAQRAKAGGGWRRRHQLRRAALRRLLFERARVDLVIMVSDINESWVDKSRHGSAAAMDCWIELKSATHRRTVLSVCCLTAPRERRNEACVRTSAASATRCLVIDNFVNGRYGSAHWLEEIEAVTRQRKYSARRECWSGLHLSRCVSSRL